MAVAIVVVDGLVDSEQPTSANMIVTTRSSVARRIVPMLATADRSTVASTRLWLNVLTSRRLREIVCGPGLAGLQRVYCSHPSLKVALTACLRGLFITSAVLGGGPLGEAVTGGPFRTASRGVTGRSVDDRADARRNGSAGERPRTTESCWARPAFADRARRGGLGR